MVEEETKKSSCPSQQYNELGECLTTTVNEKTREVTVRFMPCAKKARPDLYEQWEEAFNAKNIIVRD